MTFLWQFCEKPLPPVFPSCCGCGLLHLLDSLPQVTTSHSTVNTQLPTQLNQSIFTDTTIRYLPSLQNQFRCTVCTASGCKQSVSGQDFFFDHFLFKIDASRRQTTDIATYRKNWPEGQFFEKCLKYLGMIITRSY